MIRATLIAVVLLAVSASAWAQIPSEKGSNAPQPSSAAPATAPAPTTPAPASIPAKPPPPPPNLETLTSVEARDILGQKVSDASGAEMGLVVDVLFDETKEPRAVVVDFGGFLGVGTRKIAVDWKLLQFQPADSKTPLELALSRADIQAAPEYKEDDKTLSVVDGPLPPPPKPTQAAPTPPAAAAPSPPSTSPPAQQP